MRCLFSQQVTKPERVTALYGMVNVKSHKQGRYCWVNFQKV